MRYRGGHVVGHETKIDELKNKVANLEKELEVDKSKKYDAFFRFKYGNLLFGMKKSQEAKAQYELAVDAEPEFKDTYSNLSVCYFIEGNCAKALEAYKKAKKLGAQVHPQFEKDLIARCGN